MTRASLIIAAVIAALVCSPLAAREYRSREITREFQREHPCPSTGLTTGVCPGYRKDFIHDYLLQHPDVLIAALRHAKDELHSDSTPSTRHTGLSHRMKGGSASES